MSTPEDEEVDGMSLSGEALDAAMATLDAAVEERMRIYRENTEK